MNNAKLFLTAIGVFAIVGGALAFKAKSAFNLNYCTTTQLQADNRGCSELSQLEPSIGVGSVPYYYVLKGAPACNAQRVCNATSTRFVID